MAWNWLDAKDQFPSVRANNRDRLDREIIPEGFEDSGSCRRRIDGGSTAPLPARDLGTRQPGTVLASIEREALENAGSQG
jgi:hypothetical protein